MNLILLPKLSLEGFIQTCTPLAIIDSLENEMRNRVKSIAGALLSYAASTSADPIDSLTQFLKADEDFLGIILALTNLSQEKFKRILSAERFLNNDFASDMGYPR